MDTNTTGYDETKAEQVRMVKKRIHVTIKDIDGGVCGNPNKCAVSRAMIRQLPGLVVTRPGAYQDEKTGEFKSGPVTTNGVFFTDMDQQGMAFFDSGFPKLNQSLVTVPNRVRDWIRQFDRAKLNPVDKKACKRISFTVLVPETALIRKDA